MSFCKHNTPSEQVTLSHPLTIKPQNSIADTAKTPAYTAIMASGVLNIACYTKKIACYIIITVARTAIMAGGDKNIACYMQNIASRTMIIDNYIASDVSGLARNAANTSKTSPE